MLSYMIPQNSSVGVILIGGDEFPEIPMTLEDGCPPCAVDYINNMMPSLGGDYYIHNSMEDATQMLRDTGTNDERFLLMVTHGPPVDISQSPCELHALWHLLGYHIITLMDGDVGPIDEITCDGVPYKYSNCSKYFNNTNEYLF